MSAQPTAEELSDTAERAWRWVLDQVRTDEVGPWIPGQVTSAATDDTPPPYRDGMHSGIAGLAHVLAEIRLDRDWTDEESALAQAIGTRLRDRVQTEVSYDFFDGLVSDIGAFVALGQEGAAAAVERLAALAEPDGWPQDITEPPRYLPDARVSDATLGTASVILGALWADRHGVAGARAVLEKAADVVLAEAEDVDGCLWWRFVPIRFRTLPRAEMPNWSHGQAGILAAVALAGHRLDRDDLVDAARRGGEQLVRLGELSGDRFAVPHFLFPPNYEATSDEDEYAWGWCHGPTGTSLAFAALAHADVESVAGDAPSAWRRRCLEAVRRSGIPQRSTLVSGTTTAAAAGRLVSAPSSWTPTSGTATRPISTSPWFSRRPCWSTWRVPRTMPGGGSSSTGTPTRCCLLAWAGCRERPASPRSSSRPHG